MSREPTYWGEVFQSTGCCFRLLQNVAEEDVLRSSRASPFARLRACAPVHREPSTVLKTSAFAATVDRTRARAVVVWNLDRVSLNDIETFPAAVQVEVTVEIILDDNIAHRTPLKRKVTEIPVARTLGSNLGENKTQTHRSVLPTKTESKTRLPRR